VSFPAPTRRDHQRFCEIEGWELVSSATSRRGTHHDAYELALPSGEVLRARVSRPADRTDYGPAMWAHVLRDQLRVSEEEFWHCVGQGIPPRRGRPAPGREALPVDLVWQLVNRVGLGEEEVARLTKTEAIARMQRFWIEGE